MTSLASPPALNRPLITEPKRRAGLSSYLIFLTLIVAVGLSLFTLRLPAALPANAPPTDFSAGRTVSFIKATSVVPHWTGSPENGQIRDVILRELKEIGLPGQLQGATVSQGGTVAQVENVLARLPGTNNSRAILLLAHYDGIPDSPGASNMGAVAAMLETLRALKAGPPLKNDVIFLAADGGEIGQLGVRTFLEQNPWAKEVGLVLSFGSEGNRGPVILRQTGLDSGWAVQEYLKASPSPLGSSFLDTFFRDSQASEGHDFQPLLKERYNGLDMAYTRNRIYNHATVDTFDNLDLRAVQQLGAQELALARHFGNLDLYNTAAPEVIYFNLLGGLMLSYPSWLAFPLAVAVGLLFVVLTALGVRRQRLNPLKMLLSVVGFLVSAGLTVLAVYFSWKLITTVGKVSFSADTATYNEGWFQTGLVLLALGTAVTLLGVLGHWLGSSNLAFGVMFVWLLATLATGMAAPGASYLAVWSLLLSLLGWGLALWLPENSRRGVAFQLICAIPVVCLITVALWLAFLNLYTQVAPLAALGVIMLLGLLVPQLEIILRGRGRLLPALAAIAGVAVLGLALYLNRPDARQPEITAGVRYALNADSGKALWFASGPDAKLDSWSSQFLTGEKGPIAEVTPFYQGDFYRSEAPTLPLEAPKMEIIEDRASESMRTLRLKITSPRQATDSLMLYFSPETQLKSVKVNGQPVSLDSRRILTCYAFSKDGVELMLQVAPKSPVKLTVRDQSQSLPALLPGKVIRPRSETLMPLPATGISDAPESILVLKSFTIPALP